MCNLPLRDTLAPRVGLSRKAAAWSVRYTTEDDEVVKKSLAQVGVAYYYNLETSVAQWTCPEGFTSAETAASAASRARS